ncbi:hypothetical protein [Pseudomonas putida]|uniref:hypothetical protein n=1 Tax=Pseudomonas putida TaxID=303 RepID=UPI001E5C12E4|nr:hypothetical protein [Pseudomonas putida]MCE0958033.1 hypothetical protein [Pseudomonas putida]
MKYSLKTKERKVFALSTFVSVPKAFLALPLFNVANQSEEVADKITIPKYQNMRDIVMNSTSLTMFNDFEFFLFILRKVINSNCTDIEFETKELMDDLKIANNQRPNYLKIFQASMIKLGQINVSYKEKRNDKIVSVVFSFIEGELEKDKCTISVSKRFIEFFGSLKELYEIDPRILGRLTNEYQRMLYVLYVCNRRNDVNYFSVEMLKQRFRINSEKMPDKTFVMKIRKANIALQKMGFIEGFSETKKEPDKLRSQTIRFDVSYSYKTLYKPEVNEKSSEVSNLDAFDRDLSDDFYEENEAEITTNKLKDDGDEEWT